VAYHDEGVFFDKVSLWYSAPPMISQYTVAYALTSILLLSVSAAPTFAQAQRPRVNAAAAFGGATLDGVRDGLPPAAGTLMGALRLSVGAPVGDVRLSAETEVNLSGPASGQRFVQPTHSELGRIDHQTRRDLLWSVLGGIEIWERHRVGSLHFSAGISRVTPIITAQSQRYPAQPGSDPSLDPNISYHATWAPTIGADVLARFGRLSVGPTYRWYDYLGNVSPYLVGRPKYTTFIGLTTVFHF
jgi:hypothetical protein